MTELFNYLDTAWLIKINAAHSQILDRIMWNVSGRFTWIPFYLVIILLLFHKLKRKAVLHILLATLLIIISDQLASSIMKPDFHRLRPSHTPGLEHLLHYVNNYRGGLYGFVSSHAMNVFSFSFYLIFTIRKQLFWLTLIMLPWAFLVAYSRVYLGIHFPSDVAVPFLISPILAYCTARIYFSLTPYFFKALPIGDSNGE